MVSIILIFISSAGIYYFENEAQPEVFQSVFHSTWWSIVTLTTVGYGDVYPITVGGKIFTFCFNDWSWSCFCTGLVASSLKKAKILKMKKKFLNCRYEKNIIITCYYFFFM